jgi:hypothetical protein
MPNPGHPVEVQATSKGEDCTPLQIPHIRLLGINLCSASSLWVGSGVARTCTTSYSLRLAALSCNLVVPNRELYM